jgi:hypothetical protein
MSLPPTPSISLMGSRARRSTPEHAKPPASPPLQTSGPVLSDGGGGGGGGPVAGPLLLPPHAAVIEARLSNAAQLNALLICQSCFTAESTALYSVTEPVDGHTLLH